jgi:ATP-dependent DNA helicase RecQ
MQTTECLMQFLSHALDDPYAAPCGRCARCLGKPLLSETIRPELANAAAVYLRRSFRKIYPRKKWPERTALSAYGFGGVISPDLQTEEGRALSEWGDAGWGEMVRDGKYRDGCFSDDLVEGCIQMIQAWAPEPRATWVTCVPSVAHPQLVPEFANRLAGKLGLPFVSCVKKVKVNRPQKEMENSFQQAKNLNGVFAVEDHNMLNEPVFLVDDLVDSGWTMTVVAALLRQARCPAVFPLALALATHSSRDR